MATTESRSVRTSDGVYVKRDLYPDPSSPADDDVRHRHRDEEDDVDRPPVLKMARYAISPAPLLSLHHHHHHHGGYGFESRLTSPIPRRKQARPRRRSGDSSTTATSPSLIIDQHYKPFMSSPSPVQDMPEDLSVKKSPPVDSRQENEDQSGRNNDQDSGSETPLPAPSLKAESVNSDSAKSEFSVAERNSLFSPGPSAGPTMTTPPTPNSLLSMTPIHQSDRRKGQHSAPRGGPPRAWTNGDLTEALNHVWNRKMTTSQASRVFGIPYNSLLMYVRGKYGKSLKLDTLRKETLEGEAMALAASTRGSYKLAAAAAAAAAASTPNGSSNKTNKSNTSNESNSAPTTPTTPTATAKSVNNNNNNNNNNMNNHNHIKNNNEVKVSKNSSITPSHLNLAGAFSAPHLNEMDALSMAGLAAAGLGGFGGVNPYLSYFCDFSFPMPMGLGGLMQPAVAGAGGKHLRAGDLLHKKSSELRPSVGKISKHRAKGLTKSSADADIDADNKEDTDVDDGPSPLPLRLSRPQTGQV